MEKGIELIHLLFDIFHIYICKQNTTLISSLTFGMNKTSTTSIFEKMDRP